MSRAALTAALDELRAAHRHRRDWLRRAAAGRAEAAALVREGEALSVALDTAFARLCAAVDTWHDGADGHDATGELRLAAEFDQLAALILDH